MHGFKLADLIRLNQLVRGRIDIDGFRAWYDALPSEQRRSLTLLLCELAYQAGVNDATWDEAMAASGLPTGEPVVRQVSSVRRTEFPDFSLCELVLAVPEEELPAAFRLSVFLFGVAEGAVFRRESMKSCNHWWHRDLLDERVVRDLLADPRFYMTAMKDDARIKGRA